MDTLIVLQQARNGGWIAERNDHRDPRQSFNLPFRNFRKLWLDLPVILKRSPPDGFAAFMACFQEPAGGERRLVLRCAVNESWVVEDIIRRAAPGDFRISMLGVYETFHEMLLEIPQALTEKVVVP